jgi:cardiolipin synthase
MQSSVPNALTVSRIAAIPLLVAAFYVEEPYGNWLGLAILVFAGATDFFDGYLARTWSVQSHFGKALDPIADKLLVSAVLLMLVGFDRIAGLAILPAVVILCREFLVSGLREYLAGIRVGMPVSRLAQWKTTVQIFALGFLIVGPAGPQFGPLSTTQVGEIGLWLAAVLTLITGFDYLRAGLRHFDNGRGASDSPRDGDGRPGGAA